MSTKRFMALSAIVLVSVVAVSACTPATPEERVAGLRARFVHVQVDGRADIRIAESVVEVGVDLDHGVVFKNR